MPSDYRGGLGLKDVQLFATCLVDAFSPQIGISAVNLLESRGAVVHFPHAQTCCGQFAFNAGYTDEATLLARHFVEVFDGTEGPVISLSGSCAAMVAKEYPSLLDDGDSDEQAARIASLCHRVLDLSQWLGNHDQPEVSSLEPCRVALHQGCHATRVLKEISEPRTALENHGYKVVELDDADQCCGFGGTYSMTEPVVSTALADAKIGAYTRAVDQGATALVGADLGCLLHLQGRAARLGIDLHAWHIAEALEKANCGQREEGADVGTPSE